MKVLKALGVIVIVAGLAAILFMSRNYWKGLLSKSTASELSTDVPTPPVQEAKTLKMTEQARKNLGLVSKVAKPQEYWRTIEVSGEIVDRPGYSDRGVTSPAVGVVTEVHAFPGDTVKPGDRLFTLRLFSEYLQNTQSELFKATKEIQLITEQHARLEGLVKTGGIPESRLIELDSQLRRQNTLIQSYHQDLLTRGLNPEQIQSVSEGTFVSTIDIVAPAVIDHTKKENEIQPVAFHSSGDKVEGLAYEVEKLNVDLGQQVQAGQLLSTLANHQLLYIEGHAFKREASNLAKAAENKWPIQCTFAEDDQIDGASPVIRSFACAFNAHLRRTIRSTGRHSTRHWRFGTSPIPSSRRHEHSTSSSHFRISRAPTTRITRSSLSGDFDPVSGFGYRYLSKKLKMFSFSHPQPSFGRGQRRMCFNKTVTCSIACLCMSCTRTDCRLC